MFKAKYLQLVVAYNFKSHPCGRNCIIVIIARQRALNTERGIVRPTLCVSALFSVALCPSVHLSVCLSHWWIVSIRLKISSNFFVRPGNTVILVFFSTPSAVTQFQGNPFSGALNTRGGKKLRFSTEIVVYLGNGTKYAHGCYGTSIRSHRLRIDPCRCRRS